METSANVAIDPQAFFTTQLSLLAAEQATEVAETSLLLSAAPPSTLARAGLAINNLTVSSLKTGLGGRTVIELAQDSAIAAANTKKSGTGNSNGDKKADGALPEHGIRTGDIVRVGEMPKGGAKKKEVSELKGKGIEGVVTRVGERAIWVAAGKGSNDRTDDDQDIDSLTSGRLWMVKLANDVTYKRMNHAMMDMLKTPAENYTTLQRVLLGLSSPSPPSREILDQKLEFNNISLNQSQREAISFALASPDVALIHGPPGTGKTATVVELILQFLKRDLRVLVCGPSNISVDNIVERLALSSPSTPLVRLGHPARLLPSVLQHSLEVLTRTSEAGAIVKDVREEIDQKVASVRKAKSGKERRAIWGEVKLLRKEFREREGKCVDNLVGGSGVVLATLHGAGGRQISAGKPQGRSGFDVIVVDEAGQGLEAGCWVPLVAAGDTVRKLVLAGDHLQLPPTVKSMNSSAADDSKAQRKALEESLSKLSLNAQQIKAAKSLTLEHTLFDRLLSLYGHEIKRLLNTQYRMHESIMSFPSSELYDSELIAHPSVRDHLLKDLPYGVADTEDTREPLIFIDTQGGDFPDATATTDDDDHNTSSKSLLLGDSKSNPSEAQLVHAHVRRLLDAGVHATDIAIITPYNAQLALLRTLLRPLSPDLELGSVDGFQGREKEAVVVSLVRSNAGRDVGFLAERRRLNVAMTRARRQLCVVGDAETVAAGGAFLKRWMAFLEERADLRYPTLGDLEF